MLSDCAVSQGANGSTRRLSVVAGGKTGHVLIECLERGRHPWFVLAHQWEDDMELYETIFADKIVVRNDSSVPRCIPWLHRPNQRLYDFATKILLMKTAAIDCSFAFATIFV